MKKLSLLILIVAICFIVFRFWAQPRLTVIPEKALADVPVKIFISRVKPFEQVTITAVRKFQDSSIWQSSVTYQADSKGNIDLTTDATLAGSYQGVEPMGLFWAMKQTQENIQTPMHKDEILLSVFSHDKLLAQKTIERFSVTNDIEQKEIKQEIVGTFYYPKNMKLGPAIITLSGSSGGISSTVSQLLASHGYAVLALGYIGLPGLPDKIENIPLEYFKNGIEWLKKQPQVNPECIALWGVSYGGQLALLLGATYPDDIKAIISYVPSSLVYGGVPNFDMPSWTLNNKAIPFMPMPTLQEIFKLAQEGHVPAHKGTQEDPEEPTTLYHYGLEKFSEYIENATIQVEKIRCPVLIFSGQDDKLWPSTLYAKKIMERLKHYNSTIERKHLDFANAGHYFELPYWPTISGPYLHAVVKLWCTMGGTMQGNAHAAITAWQTALEFLKEHLSCPQKT